MPYGADASLFIPGAPKALGSVRVEEYDKRGLTMDVKCASVDDMGGWNFHCFSIKGTRHGIWIQENDLRYRPEKIFV